jgi:hypothetical protein
MSKNFIGRVCKRNNGQIFGGTSRFRGTQVEKHCSRISTRQPNNGRSFL